MTIIQLHPLYPIAFKICQQLVMNGFIAYFAGGCVRDALMGNQAQDLDIATSATPDDIVRIFSKTVPVGKAFGVIIVVEEGHEFEVATFRQDGGYQDGRRPESIHFCGPEIDAQRRDFTMNALFYDPLKNQILDYVHGEQAIQQKIIQTVGLPELRLQEDHLRILRGVRFSAQLNFSIEEKTFQAMQRLSPLVKTVSVERLQQELTKMLRAKYFLSKLEIVLQSQILQNIFPEVSWQKNLWPSELTSVLEKEELGPWIQFWIWYQRSGNLSFLSLQNKIEQFRFSSAEKKCILQALSWQLDFARYQDLGLGEYISLGFEHGHGLGQRLRALTSITSEKVHQSLQILSQYQFRKPEPFLRAADLDLSLKGEELGAALKKLYHLQLEGVVKTKSEALEFYHTQMKQK